MVDFPGWPLGNGANKSNDDEDEWDYDTMLTTRSELNTIAAIEHVTDRVRTGTYCRGSRNTGADVASRIHIQIVMFFCACRTDSKAEPLNKRVFDRPQFLCSAPRPIYNIGCVNMLVLATEFLR